MKYGAHQNWCNGPGDCSCGQDYKEFARRAVDKEIEADKQRNKLYSNPVLLRKKAVKLIEAAEKLEKAKEER